MRYRGYGATIDLVAMPWNARCTTSTSDAESWWIEFSRSVEAIYGREERMNFVQENTTNEVRYWWRGPIGKDRLVANHKATAPFAACISRPLAAPARRTVAVGRAARGFYHGYGRITIDEYTALVEGIMAMTFGPGEHSIRLPTAASFNTQKDAEDIAALFQGRADEMGWDVRSSNVREVSDGWIVEVFFWVSESGRTERGAVPYFIPQEKKQSNFVTGLGIVIGVGVLGALIYYGSTR